MAQAPDRSDHLRPVWAQRFTLEERVPARPLVVHDFMALGFVTSGSAVMQQRERYDVQAGDVFLVPAGERHGLITARSPEAWGISFCPACYAPSEFGALLDNSLVFFSSEIADGNAHDHDNLPVLLAGGGGGAVTPGRHLVYPRNTPIANLFLSMLRSVGVNDSSFGADRTGPLANLS